MLRPRCNGPRCSCHRLQRTARIPIRTNHAFRFPYASMWSAVYPAAAGSSSRIGTRDDVAPLDPFDKTATAHRPRGGRELRSPRAVETV